MQHINKASIEWKVILQFVSLCTYFHWVQLLSHDPRGVGFTHLVLTISSQSIHVPAFQAWQKKLKIPHFVLELEHSYHTWYLPILSRLDTWQIEDLKSQIQCLKKHGVTSWTRTAVIPSNIHLAHDSTYIHSFYYSSLIRALPIQCKE